MPYICIATDEMALEGLPDAVVTSETNPKTLCSITIVKARSEKSGQIERWVWKEENELDEQESEAFLKLMAARTADRR